MRHHNANRKFGREKGQRTALLRSLASSLIVREKISTTEARAKEIRPYVEKLVTKAKVDSIGSRRHVLSVLGNAARPTKKLFTELGPRYKERKGGYLRIVKVPSRRGDGAALAQIEFVV